MACVALNILLTWFFIQIIGYIGIALVFVIQKAVKNLILLYCLKNKITYKLKSALIVFVKIVIASVLFLILIAGAKTFVFYEFNENLIEKIGFLTLTFVFMGSIYLFILYKWGLLNINGDEIRK